MKTNSHSWKFFRAGGFDQVKLETGADLMNLDQLDQKLWVALACPTTGLEFDPKTAALIDTDKDGRIRAPELIAAVKWAGSMLKNPDDLVKGGETDSHQSRQARCRSHYCCGRFRPWKFYLFLAVVLGLLLGWYLGKLDRVLPAKVKSTTVMGTNAPAYKAPPPVTNTPPPAP